MLGTDFYGSLLLELICIVNQNPQGPTLVYPGGTLVLNLFFPLHNGGFESDFTNTNVLRVLNGHFVYI